MTKPPKKSETLEVRLPHALKQAFMDRCRAEGRTSSEAVRGFIETYLAPSARPRSRSLRWLAAGAAVVAVGAAAAPSLARTSLPQTFRRLDVDGDGYVSRPEFLRSAQVQAAVSLGGGLIEPALDGRERRALAQSAFDRADADHDGRLDFAEFSRAWRR